MDEYKDIFISELEDNTKLLSDSLILLEKNPKDVSPLSEVIRAAHTVKGMAATMGYTNLTNLTHIVESKIREVEQEKAVTKSLLEVLFQVVDRLEQFKEVAVEEGDLNKVPVDDLVQFLSTFNLQTDLELEQDTQSQPSEFLKLENRFTVVVKFKRNAPLLSTRAFQLLRDLERIAVIEDSTPSKVDISEGKVFGEIHFELVTNETEGALRKVIEGITDVDEVEITSVVEEAIVPQRQRVKFTRGIQTVRVNLNQLDEVVDLLGELVLARSRLENHVAVQTTPEVVEDLNQFDSLITTIQDKLMKMRMVTLARIFDNYPRTVRDIANKRGIDINLFTQGNHIELDRSVIDQVNEALLHLIRNAATHGIEDTSTRKKLSKSKEGTVRVIAVQEKGEVSITVEDDGSGLDLERIRSKGIELGLITENTKLTRSQVAALIFNPGFSTASQVTEAAGRGIGMDIVKETIEEIGGSIQLRTKKGEGTQFILRVPQTLAIIEALIVIVNEHVFAIPLLNVVKIYSEKDQEIEIHEQESYVKEEDYTLPIFDLEYHLEIPNELSIQKKDTGRKKSINKKVILWEKGGKRIAMKVSDVLEQREIVTKQISSNIQQFPGYSGATILKEEEVVLIIDPTTLNPRKKIRVIN